MEYIQYQTGETDEKAGEGGGGGSEGAKECYRWLDYLIEAKKIHSEMHV